MKTPTKIDATDWTVTEILPISMSGPITDIKTGSVRVIHSGNEHSRRFNWKAKRLENQWKIMGDGAVMQSGSRVKDAEKFPFMTDAVFNLRLSRIISNFLDEELGVTSSEPKRVEASPSQTTTPLPTSSGQAKTVGPVSWRPAVTVSGGTQETSGSTSTPSVGQTVPPEPAPYSKAVSPEPPPIKEVALNSNEQTGSLADRIAAKVCATYGNITVADMRNSESRGLHTRVRQIITYLLRELGQKNRVILATIGASETSTTLIYINHRRIVGLLKTDDDLRVKVDALLKEFSSPDLGGVQTGTVRQSVVPTSPHSQNRNGLVGRITNLVSEAALVPVLLGSGTSMLDLGPARIARACLLFDLYRDMISKRIPSETPPPVDEVETQVVEALEQLRQSNTEVSRIVSQVKKRLASETVV